MVNYGIDTRALTTRSLCADAGRTEEHAVQQVEDSALSECASEPVNSEEHVRNSAEAVRKSEKPREIGGRGGLDPTRYGDWEKAGRCIDF